MAIFDEATHEILMKFLDKKAQDAEREITERGTLSEEHAIPLILKSQFNHIAHLDTEITELRGVMDKRFEQITNDMNGRFAQITKLLLGTVAFLSLLMTALRFIR
jgi:hypothetical protein